MNNSIKVKGKIEILEEGKVVYENNNLVVNSGLEWLCDRMKDDTATYLDYIGVGTDATVVSASDTSLYSELDRNQSLNKTAGVGTFMIEALFSGSEAQGVWKEAAIFTEATGGVMFDRVNIDFTKSNKNVTVRFTVTFANA